MKVFYKTLKLLVAFLLIGLQQTIAQSVIDPADPVITYNPASPPVTPPGGQIGKWVRTVRLGWNTTEWKAYYLNGVPFRVKFPKSYNHTANDGKKYPSIAFFHGLGERGPATDNEFSMANGGVALNAAVVNGSFDGFIIIMQSEGGWGANHMAVLAQILEYMAVNNKLDPFRTSVNGLSAGGYTSWDMMIAYPRLITAALPMSGIAVAHKDAAKVNIYKFKPVWYFQGALDNSPHPSTANEVNTVIYAAGGNYKYTLYPNLGHGTWDASWAQPDFYPFCTRVYASNPWPLFGRTEFCPGETFNVTIGVSPGFDAYEWRKDGNPISGATGNSIQATTIGRYEARIRKGTVWSDWSRVPVEIKLKAPTVTPPITVSGLMSKVIPALDTNSVTLSVPAGYESYVWQKVGNTTTISTTNTLRVTTPGDYVARVTEQYGCSSSFSTPFTVVNANGTNVPSPAANLVATTLTKTSIKLDWTDNPSPQYNETNYEVYQSTNAGGGYKLIAITAANVTTFTATGLNPKTKYYYTVRAVNATSASAASNQASASTDSDILPPTAPGNLEVLSSTKTSVTIAWDASTDDIGVVRYEVYIDGNKAYPATGTQLTINELTPKQSYNFSVRALDGAGNQSPFSNQVTGQPVLTGLEYKHYTFTGTWNNLPNFSTLTPVATGVMSNVAITPRVQDEQFAFLWEGFITIPTTGTYYFRTTSDDGSKLYLGNLGGTTSPYSFSATALVNNDGLHGSQSVNSVARTLTAGVYPIAITFYEQGGGEAMSVAWRTPASGSNYVAIPNSAFQEAPANNGSAPAAPSGLSASPESFRSVNLSWTDNSNNETGFEIWRSLSRETGFEPVGTTAANVTSFKDSIRVEPATTYFYKIRSIGEYGESGLIPVNDVQANWKLNNNYADAGLQGKVITPVSSPVFSTDRKEGSHSIDFNGTNQDLALTTAAGDYLRGGYTQKTVAFWMKADNTTNNRGVFDFGGSDNGLAMRINSNSLIAGIASGSTRRNISVTYNSLDWNHITLVYSTNTLRMYVNGALVSSNTSLGFNSVGTTSDASMIGDDNNTNALNTAFNNFDGRFDDVYIFGKALTVAEIASVMNDNYGKASATTPNLPATPSAPSQLLATGASTTSVNVTWNDNSGNETGFDLYRSISNTSNYIKITSLATNTTSFTDTDLFPNSVYYYRILATGVGGSSAYSNADSAKTLNNLPVLTAVPAQTVHYQSVTTLNVSATDVDGGNITLTLTNKPAFVTLQSTGNGTADITFTPNGTQGVYPSIILTATDEQGGSVSTTFNLTVNDNYHPVIATVQNVTLNENQSATINLTATDQNTADVLTWSVSNLPEGFTLTPGQNGSATLVLQPGYASAGQYTPEIKVVDGNGGVGVVTFSLTVNDKNPDTKIYARVQYANVAGAPWNNMTGPVTNALKDELNNTTGVGIRFNQPWWMPFNAGPTTGNNSGVYPDAVLNDFWYFGYYGGPETASVSVTGLNPAKKYSLTLYAGSNFDGGANNGTTVYTVGSKTVSLYVQGNTQNTVSLNDLAPAGDGTITVNMAKAPGTPIGYLNAIVITQLFDDGSAPAAPKDLAAQNIIGQGIRLNWNDVAYNETGYEIHRSLTEGGSYSLVGTVDPNVQTYTDATVSGSTSYFYKVRSVNSYGNSAYTAVVTAKTANRIPTINTVANVLLKNTENRTITVTAVDDPTDNLRLAASGLPNFASFTDNGNGTGTVTITPNSGSIGIYSDIVITATDNSDSTGSANFSIVVTDSEISNTYVNFTNENNIAAKPWNNMVAPAPYAGLSISGLRDDSDINTGVTVTLTDAWQGASVSGIRSGNGREVYSDKVSRVGLYGNAGNRRITVTGLNNSKKYNFVFYNSHGLSESTLTNFTINGQTVGLNGSYNADKTVQINGITPVSGTVVITVAKDAAAVTALLNSMIIQSYTPTASTLLSPSDLRVTDAKLATVTLQWQDRADNETNYEIWRATEGGSYSLLATVPANTTTYTNTNLAANTSFNYTVRAKAGTAYSRYSNSVKGYTYQSQVYINFNGPSRKAGAPWNNLNWSYGIGASWDNFKNDAGVPTNIGMRQPVKVDGLVDLGVNTGNNSGIYPDNVMVESFGMFPGLPTYVKLVGLSTARTYDFTFFASVSGYFGDQTTFYTVNGKTVLLNTLNNKSGTVTMYDVVADANGEVIISFGSYESATFGLLGGLIIKGYTKSELPTPAPPVTLATVVEEATKTATVIEVSKENDVMVQKPVEQLSAFDLKQLGSYPNPFDQSFTLAIPSEGNENVQIRIFDSRGVMVYDRRTGGLIKGINQVRVDTNRGLTPGVYVVRVMYIETGKTKTIKVIKR